MRVGIIETGRPPDALKGAHGNYPDMFVALLGREDPSLHFSSYATVDGIVPKDPHECDAWLITGSRHGVYEKLPWMLELEAFVRRSFQEKVPVVGICFGHQIMAEALGGKVVKSGKGWGVGHHTYAVTDRPSWMADARGSFTIAAVHQDQVVEVPEGGKVVATSEFCENAAIAYDDLGFSIQGHPEFREDYQRDLFEVRLKPIVPASVIAEAEQSLATKGNDSPSVARWIVRFLQEGAARRAVAGARAAE